MAGASSVSDVRDVRSLLSAVQLSQYAPPFEEEGVDLETLKGLTRRRNGEELRNFLKELGMSKGGHREKVVRICREILGDEI